MRLTVVRDPKPGATPGFLQIDGRFFCYTLEDEERSITAEDCSGKVYGKTCIPRGVYQVKLTYSSRFRMVTPELQDVPCFKYIRIHPGNSVDDTEGCPLVGMHQDGSTVTASRAAFENLMEVLKPVAKFDIPIEIEFL